MYPHRWKIRSVPAGGFTLLEVLIAVVLVGLAIASLLVSSRALTQANGAAAELSTAEFLIEEIRELTTALPVVDPEGGTDHFGSETDEAALADYDDLDDFDSASFSPPINAECSPLSGLSAYSQQITVENVSAANFEQVVADHSSPFVRITVTIELNSRQISSANWLRAMY